MGKSESVGYKTVWKKAKPDPKFPDGYIRRLVRTQSDLVELIDEIKSTKKIAVDTETTHTDWGYGHIVGMSISCNPDSGWYLPFRHEDYKRNLPLALLPKLYKLMLGKRILMYNAIFDEIMLDKEGWDCSKLKIRDVMGLVYLMDTNIHLPSLKDSALYFLGRPAPTFEETLKGREHFGFIPPEEAYEYACYDTIDTYSLDNLLYPMVHNECPTILKLDTEFVPILRKLSSTKLYVRTELLDKLLEHYKVSLKELEGIIFKDLGYPINLNSNKQLEMAFKQNGIDTGYKTDKGAMSLKSEVLDLIAYKYPFVKNIVKYKSMSSIQSALKKFTGKSWIRCNYEMYNTVTGRMSSGSAKDEGKIKLPKGVRPFFDPFNAQNFLKAKDVWYRGIYAPDDPYNILGYRFEQINKEDIKPDDLVLEAMDYRGNPRRLIHAYAEDENGNVVATEETHYWVKADYSGAELRLGTLFSKEPVLMEAFLKGIDPHTNTAKMMFGITDKAHRGKAKTCNFSLLYEGSADSLCRNSGLEYKEADELWHKYWDTMKVLKSWKIKEQQKANIRGKCTTFMGRPRRLQWYFTHPKLSMRSFGKRSVISHEIQGSLGDIIKMTLIKSHKYIFDNPEWKDNHDAIFTMTIHDEIDAVVRKERLNEYLDTLLALGKVHPPEWEFPLELSVDLGYSYGFVLGIDTDENGKWHIKFKKGSDVIG